MKRVTISSSLRSKGLIRQAIADLKEAGVEGLFPNLETGIVKESETITDIRKVVHDHFEAIDDSESMYVICPKGYVGRFVSVEIGYAHAKGKPIIFSEKPKDLGLQAIASKYISLNKIKNLKVYK